MSDYFQISEKIPTTLPGNFEDRSSIHRNFSEASNFPLTDFKPLQSPVQIHQQVIKETRKSRYDAIVKRPKPIFVFVEFDGPTVHTATLYAI